MFNLKKAVLYWTSIICLLTAAFLLVLGKDGYFDLFWSVPVFFLLLGFGTCWSIKKMLSVSNARFTSAFMISIFLKLLFSITFIMLYVFFVKEQQFIILISFFVYYITLLVFETIYLLKPAKKEKTNEKQA